MAGLTYIGARRWSLQTGGALGILAGLLWAMCSPAALAAGSIVVTAGNQQITFSGTPKSGVVGDANGYDTLAFNLETGQGGMGGDLQIGSGSNGGATLSGNLEIVPQGGALPSAPISTTVPATAGETLLVLDGSGNYALVQITNATSQTVWFTYAMQSSVTIVQPPSPPSTTSAPSSSSSTTGSSGSYTGSVPQPQPQPQPAPPPMSQPQPQPQPTQQSSPSNSGQGVYALPGNCATVSDNSGNSVLQVVVETTPMFSGQTVASAEQNRELILNVGVAAPTDVTGVAVQQSGQVGGYPWTTHLHPLGQSGNGLWQFSMQQSDLSQPYQIMISSPTLVADGIANPSTGVAELDWNFDPTQGCGGSAAAAPSNQPGSNQSQTQTQNTEQQPSQSGQTPQGSGPGSQATGQGTPATATIRLQIGSTTAAVDGQSETLAVPAEIDSAGRTLVPFRFLGQALGATVSWDGPTRTASYQLGSMDVAVTIGSETATVNGRPVTLDAPPVIVDGSTLVPVRFISQALGAQVSWDASTQTVAVAYTAPSGGSSGSGPSGTSSVPSGSGGYNGGVPFGSCADCIHWNFN